MEEVIQFFETHHKVESMLWDVMLQVNAVYGHKISPFAWHILPPLLNFWCVQQIFLLIFIFQFLHPSLYVRYILSYEKQKEMLNCWTCFLELFSLCYMSTCFIFLLSYHCACMFCSLMKGWIVWEASYMVFFFPYNALNLETWQVFAIAIFSSNFAFDLFYLYAE